MADSRSLPFLPGTIKANQIAPLPSDQYSSLAGGAAAVAATAAAAAALPVHHAASATGAAPPSTSAPSYTAAAGPAGLQPSGLGTIPPPAMAPQGPVPQAVHIGTTLLLPPPALQTHTPPQPQLAQAQAAAGAVLQGPQQARMEAVPSQVVHTTQPGQPVENFIPFRLPDLRDQLMHDYPKVFVSPEVKAQFTQLCKWLSARNTLRLALAFSDVKETYAYVDPDNDAEDPGAGREDKIDKQLLQHQFEQGFLSVLDKGAFDEVPEEELLTSTQVQGLKGVDVEPCDPNLVTYNFWFRGKRPKTLENKSWRTCYRMQHVETVVYERLALLFKSPPADQVEAYLTAKEERTWGKFFTGCCGHCFRRKRVAMLEEATVKPDYLYLKLFKEVEVADLDMLLPGATAKFTWIDWCMIWIPIIIGVSTAIWKAATGTMDFSDMANVLISLALIVMPLTWGVKAYLAVKEKMADYQAYLNELCLTHNLDNNAGVLTGVLDEAQEQEDNEALLAYFFLWRGLSQPTPMTKLELDTAVEAYLGSLIKKQGLTVVLDFEVCDSISKLEAMGLLTSSTGVDGQQLLQVLPLAQAVEQAHVKNFNDKQEVSSARRMGRLTTAARAAAGQALPAWQECMGSYQPTGQMFRYWFNHDTGESTYRQPEDYVPLSATAYAAGWSSPSKRSASVAVRA